jgi:hypothetical protein
MIDCVSNGHSGTDIAKLSNAFHPKIVSLRNNDYVNVLNAARTGADNCMVGIADGAVVDRHQNSIDLDPHPAFRAARVVRVEESNCWNLDASRAFIGLDYPGC